MFVLHALVLTFVTTPLTLWIYPMSARGLAVTVPAAGDGLKDEEARKNASEEAFKTKFSVVLDKLEQVGIPHVGFREIHAELCSSLAFIRNDLRTASPAAHYICHDLYREPVFR